MQWQLAEAPSVASFVRERLFEIAETILRLIAFSLRGGQAAKNEVFITRFASGSWLANAAVRLS